MSVLLLTVAVAAWSSREKSRCMIPGSLANFQVLLSFEFHYSSEHLRPAVTFSRHLLSAICCSHGEYLGHARFVGALIRRHLRPNCCKEQVLRHHYPIIGHGLINRKRKQGHLPTQTASHREVISAFLLIHFGWFTNPSSSWLLIQM